MKSIRTKISLITAAAVLVTVFSVFVFSNGTIQAENDRESVEMMNLICRNAAQTIESYLEDIEQAVEMSAVIATDSLDSIILVETGAAGSAYTTGERTPEQKEALDAYLVSYIDRLTDAVTSIAGRTRGIITYYYCIDTSISENEHGFFYSRVGKTGFRQEPSLDARELDPADTEHTTWYFTPIQRGRPSWVGPYLAHFLNEMFISSYLVPIYRSGQLIGVLGMDIPFDTIADEIRDIKVYKTGFACLLDENGKILYHPEFETGFDPAASGVPVDDVLYKLDQNGDKLIRYKMNGVEKQLSFLTLSNGMKLIVTAPSSEINAESGRVIQNIVGIALFIIGLYTIGMMWIIGKLTQPLRSLTDAAQKLADADYDVDLDYRGQDEVGVLTEAFSAMRDDLQLYIEDLNRRLLTDDLTGLPNMRYFFDLSKEKRDEILGSGGHPAAVFFNLIGIKHYNRQYGFEQGDELIKNFAGLLVRYYGEKNVSRFASDHFAVATSEDKLEENIEAVFEECKGLNGGKSVPVRAGIYLARLGAVDPNVAFDRAKYASDRHRDTYVSNYYYFDSDMLQSFENARYITANFDRAIAERWIRVYYQPIVRADSKELCDEEALSRWIDPVKGMLTPGEFIPVLESSRLIYRLDLYVLDRILEKMNEQKAAGKKMVPQSINLSRSDFDSCDIVEEVRRRVDDSGIGRDMITIEVTESIVAEDFEFMKGEIGRFKDLGFRVWMDDFGSGYSSLDVLQDIQFDLIKYDMAFMQHFDDGEKSRIMLSGLINMAKAMGIDTLCEGVETAEEVEFLKDIGCTELQGYYFGRPEPY